MLAKLDNDNDKEDVNLDTKISTCFTLLTSSLLHNGLESLEDLEATSLELVSDIYKVPL